MTDLHFEKMKKQVVKNYRESFEGALVCFNEWLAKNGHSELSIPEQQRVALEAGIDTAKWRKYRQMVEHQIKELDGKFLWRQIESINATLDEFWKVVRADLKIEEGDVKRALCEILEAFLKTRS